MRRQVPVGRERHERGDQVTQGQEVVVQEVGPREVSPREVDPREQIAGGPPASGLVGPWGRIAEDGTVFVRTEAGEREIGSWQAGSAQDGLAHFSRRYEQLATEVTLLEQRLRSGAGDPTAVAASARRLKASVPTAAAVGDLTGLERRVDGLLERTEEAVEAARAGRAEQRLTAVAAKTALVEEAERFGGSSEWRVAGERLRTLGEDWKRISGVDKKTDDELWQRVAAARKRFAERRTTHFGALEQQRDVSRGRKERLIETAKQLSSSTDWRATADRYKQLMADWKTAGRAPREAEDELWSQFKAAQDVFFAARAATYAEQDADLRGNQAAKEQLLVEAEALDPTQGRDRATRQLRELQERWEAAGKVPRDAVRSLEERMGRVEDRFREAREARLPATESPFVVRLRDKVAELEGKLDRAVAAGRPTEELEASLATQRQWLSQAGGASRTPSGPEATHRPAHKRTTSAWVRSDS